MTLWRKIISVCRKQLPYAVLSISLLITVFLWHLSSNYLKAKAGERFALRVDKITSEIEERLYICRTILRSLSALLTIEGEVNRDQWRTYIENLRLQDRYPGIQGVGFSKLIQPDELQAHIAKMRAEGFPNYTVWPQGERAEYTSIIYLEPFDTRNQRAFGYDMFSELVRHTAMGKARDTDLAVLSGKVLLVQETKTDIQNGFLMYIPVYKKDMPCSTVQERKASLLGYVYSPYRAVDLMEGIFARHLQDIDLEIYDGTDISESSLLYDADAKLDAISPDKSRSFRDRKILDIHQHKWTLYFSSLPPFEAAHETKLPLGILLFGGIISVLLFIIIWSQERARQKIRAALEYAENLARFPNENPDPVLRINGSGEVIFKNRAVDNLLKKSGFSEQDVWKLFPGNIKELTKDILQTGKPLRNVESVAGDSIYSYTMVPISKQGYINIYGTDITERRKLQEELKKWSLSLEQRVSERTKEIKSAQNAALNLLEDLGAAKNSLEISKASFHNIVEKSTDGIVVLNKTGIVQFVNPAAETFLGRYAEELIGRPLCFPVITNETIEIDINGPNKEPRIAEMRVVETQWNNQPARLALIRDITDRKQTEEELRDSEIRLKTIFEDSTDGILLADIETRKFQMYNKAICCMLGYTGEEIMRLGVDDIHPEKNLPQVMEVFKNQAERGIKLAESLPVKRKDGSVFYADVNTSLITMGGKKYLMGNFRDITERKRVEEKIKEAMKAKTEFTSVVSHELRTPLTAIKEGIALVVDGLVGDINEEQNELLGIAKNNVDRLARLINDVLDFQKLDSSMMKFNLEVNDINKVVKDVYATMASSAKKAGLDLLLELDNSLTECSFDSDKITQVLTNLVTNAIKFTTEGNITIKTGRNGDSVIVSVKDTGIGIRKKDLPRVFGKFEQLQHGGDRKTGGTGLGLAISKEIIESHGGSIKVKSIYGEGSTFTFTLPIHNKNLSETNLPMEVSKMSEKKILIVDDEPDVLRLTSLRLEKLGFQVLTAANGREALETIQNEKPDLAMLDLIMPVMYGSEVCKLVKSDETLRHIPIILFTAHNEIMTDEKAKDLGADGFISKPFFAKELVSKVEQILAAGAVNK